MAENEIPVVMVYAGEKPKDATGYTKVEAQATIKDESGTVTEYRKASIWYKFGSDLDDAANLHSKEVVFEKFLGKGKIDIQGLMRSDLASDEPERVKSMETYMFGTSRDRIARDPVSAGEAAFDRMSAEEQEKFLQTMIEKREQAAA